MPRAGCADTSLHNRVSTGHCVTLPLRVVSERSRTRVNAAAPAESKRTSTSAYAAFSASGSSAADSKRNTPAGVTSTRCHRDVVLSP